MQSLDLLDAVLSRLGNGVRIGDERDLEQLLSRGSPLEGLREWVAQQTAPTLHPPDFEIMAAIFGDGTLQHALDSASSKTHMGCFT